MLANLYLYSLQISRVLHNLQSGVPGVVLVCMIINIYNSSRRTIAQSVKKQKQFIAA